MITENDRSISLLHIGYKIQTTLIIKLLNPYVSDIVEEHQCRFRKSKLTIGHIHTIR